MIINKLNLTEHQKTYSGKECKFSQSDSEDAGRSVSFLWMIAEESFSCGSVVDGGELMKSMVSCSRIVASSGTLSFNFDYKNKILKYI